MPSETSSRSSLFSSCRKHARQKILTKEEITSPVAAVFDESDNGEENDGPDSLEVRDEDERCDILLKGMICTTAKCMHSLMHCHIRHYALGESLEHDRAAGENTLFANYYIG